MDPQRYTRRLLQVLAEERASHGHGAAADIDQQLQRSEGYLGRVLRGEVGLQVEMLFSILDVLGSEPSEFFPRVVGAHQADPEKFLARLERQSSLTGSPLLEQAEALLNSEVETRSDEGDLSDFHQRLRKIDNLQFSDPKAAHGQSLRAVEEAIHLATEAPTIPHLELLSLALGVIASIDRVLVQFPTAARALRIAFSFTRRNALDFSHARLLQRACYLVSDQGDYSLALEFARQASDLYLKLDARTEIGKTLVDRGIMLNHLDRTQEAIQSLQSSLTYLPESEWQNRFSVSQGLGQIYATQGDLKKASHYTTEAKQIHRTQKGQNWWRLLWLQAELDLQQNHLEPAVDGLRSVRKFFMQQGNPFDLALVSITLAKGLFLLENHREVQVLAAEMISLLKPLRKHKIASASIHELARAALIGKVNIALLDRIYAKIQCEFSSCMRR